MTEVITLLIFQTQVHNKQCSPKVLKEHDFLSISTVVSTMITDMTSNQWNIIYVNYKISLLLLLTSNYFKFLTRLPSSLMSQWMPSFQYSSHDYFPSWWSWHSSFPWKIPDSFVFSRSWPKILHDGPARIH